MMRKPPFLNVFQWLTIIAVLACCEPPADEKALFDGKSLAGWEGDPEFFRVEDGAIVAGRLDQRIPQNEFISTMREFEDFEIRLKVKLVGEGDNAGVQFRSQRVHDSHEMSGYQADIGYIRAGWVRQFDEFRPLVENLPDSVLYPLWGALYDESRRDRVLALGERTKVLDAIKPGEWNALRVQAMGDTIRTWVNEVQITAYVEKENMPRKGIIGLQVHSGPPLEAWYKDIYIREL